MDQFSQNPGAAVYSRAPVYSPFQNPAHVDDTFGYLANMYGPMLVEGFAGPDAFLAHQMPSQALSDQYAAARYQRQSVQSISAANTRGNEEVARKLIGIQSFLSGGAPITQLDRENANTGAAVLNNPLFKQFGAAMIGAENLEGLMFGRRGDPTALAAAVNRMGYYRQDATGNRRMSAESQQQFSTEVYENLFGDDANINEMRGFGAVAAGTLAEDLFQRGMLPKSMGAMSAADRVNLISKSKRDDATVSRLADDFAHRDLMERDEDYASATSEEQKIIRADKLGDYKSRLNKTFSEIDKYRADDPKAKSAAEIEQLDAYGFVANAVDAQRTSKTVKEYTGAVAAIREIFGDSGRGDAPIQELIASLEQLSGGSMMNMSPGKMQQLMGGLRLAARETGRDLSALSAGMEQSMAIGRQYGLRGSEVLEGEAGRLHTAQALSDAGVYEKQAFGKLNKGELEARQKELSLRGDASGVSRMLASMNRLVSENPEMFKGTKMEAAMQAYQKGETTFEYGGKKINLAEMAGREGVSGLRTLAEESGAEQAHIFAYMNDKSTDEYRTAGYAYKAQAYEIQRNMSRQNESRMRDAMATDEFKAATKPRGMSDEEFSEKNDALARGFSYKITGIIMDETDGMSAADRAAHIEKRGKEELTTYFKSSAGGNLNQRQAEAQAERYFNAMYGEDPLKRKASLNAAYAEISGVTQQRTGENIEVAKQLYNKEAQEVATERVQQDTRRAARQTELSVAMGTESSIAQRMGEELDAIGAGDDASLERVLNITSKDAMQQHYAPEMREGLAAAAKMYGEAIVTPEKIRELGDQAARSPNSAAAKQLKQMAGYDQNKKLNEEEQAGLVERAVRRSAYTAAGATEKERAQNEDAIKRANMIFKAYNTGADGDIRAASRAIAQEMLGPDADDKKIAAFSDVVLSADPKQLEKQMQSGIFGGSMTDEQKERTLAVATALRDAKEMGGLEKAGFAVDTKESLAAADRPAAQLYEYKKAVNARIREDVADTIDNRAFKRLKPTDVSEEVFAASSRDMAKETARALTNVVADEMGGAEALRPEERAKYMTARTKEKMAEYFEKQGDEDGASAARKADKYFGAMFGTDERAIQKQMEKFYAHGKDVAQERGLSPDKPLYVAPATSASGRPTVVADARVSPSEKIAQKTYDAYDAAMGVPKEATAAQNKLVDDAAAKDAPSAETMLDDSEKREAILTLPRAVAEKFIDKLPAAQQEKLITRLEEIKNNDKAAQTERQQAHRLHDIFKQRQETRADSRPQTPAPEKNKYNYAEMGVPEEITPEQQKLVDALAKDPEGREFEAAIRDERNRQLLLTLPDEDAAALFNKLTPEAQQRNLDNMRQFKGSMLRYALPKDQQKNLDRLHDVISTQRDGVGSISSNNMRADTIAQLAPAATQFNESSAYDENEDFYEMALAGTRAPSIFSADPSAKTQAREVDRVRSIFSSAASISQTGGADRAIATISATRGPDGSATQIANKQESTVNVNGTLVLHGLSEAVMQAAGRRMEDTPDGGVPIDMGGPQGAYFGK